MLIRRLTLLLFLFMGLGTGPLWSQGSTIERSWENPKPRKHVDKSAYKPYEKKAAEQPATEHYNPWQQSRSAETYPWPALPQHPGALDYHEANTMLIDSLTNLYCLSTNYLRYLRQRNDLTVSLPKTPAEKEFAYTKGAHIPESVREQLKELYDELQTLLVQCIEGR
ncbi:MAG: hypothetical protein GXO82_02600 [Chlorobi bacterium]|nr:hypothetical protein [Chlorobiota bacterium]